MSDAIARMAFYLVGAKPWTPDRDSPGPYLKPMPKPARKRIDVTPTIQARILATIRRYGPATGEQIAARIHAPSHSVNAKLSRLYRDGLLDRAPDARSPHNGRLIQVYKLK